MVKSTFLNLPEEKKQRITDALLHEFSEYPLTKAQVARIVKEAQIARGAFYKYFDDLTDAYLYLYKLAISEIHMNMRPDDNFDPDHFYDLIVKFLDKTRHGKYEAMMKMHMLHNESELPDSMRINSQHLLKMTPQIWAAMVLSHEVINSVFADPKNEQANLARYKESLYLISKGSKK